MKKKKEEGWGCARSGGGVGRRIIEVALIYLRGVPQGRCAITQPVQGVCGKWHDIQSRKLEQQSRESRRREDAMPRLVLAADLFWGYGKHPKGCRNKSRTDKRVRENGE